ncbi:hypothetical protein NPIL_309751 [Nephila pilipes]|uniref:Uncharacterized protein n=1 Tax=Nephila pilipes TaxID=299642 RepID=A0A8X6QM26_NEPPI|nr:hypothetical protein NPIL_309751 [Nephila pilipes]
MVAKGDLSECQTLIYSYQFHWRGEYYLSSRTLSALSSRTMKPMFAHPTNIDDEVLNRFGGNEFTCEFKYDGGRALNFFFFWMQMMPILFFEFA